MDFLMAKAGNPMMQFLPLMIIMFAVMYFLIIRPQKQKEKKKEGNDIKCKKTG
jgi:preprotein translocase YajC subunit